MVNFNSVYSRDGNATNAFESITIDYDHGITRSYPFKNLAAMSEVVAAKNGIWNENRLNLKDFSLSLEAINLLDTIFKIDNDQNYEMVKKNLEGSQLSPLEIIDLLVLIDFMGMNESIVAIFLEKLGNLEEQAALSIDKGVMNLKLGERGLKTFLGLQSDATIERIIEYWSNRAAVNLNLDKVLNTQLTSSRELENAISGLKSLDLGLIRSFPGELLQNLIHSKHLEALTIRFSMGVNGEHVKMLLNGLTSMKVLNLVNCINICEIGKIDRDLDLQKLCLSGSKINDEDLIEIANKSPNLKILDISNCINLTASSIKKIISSCSYLEEVNCKNNILLLNQINEDKELKSLTEKKVKLIS